MFVLSGEPELVEASDNVDFSKFYRTRISILTYLEKNFPNKHRDLIDYFNSNLFSKTPTDLAEMAAHDAEGLRLLALMATAVDDISDTHIEGDGEAVGENEA